jgi:hypothetical protein
MAGVSASELRRFAWTVGGAFLFFGTVSWWRGHEIPPRVLWTLGVLLVVPGVLAPRLLAPVHRFWMGPVVRGAARVGDVVSRVVLTLLFFLVFAPVGFFIRRRRDPLNRSLADPRPSEWIRRERQPVDPARYEQAF